MLLASGTHKGTLKISSAPFSFIRLTRAMSVYVPLSPAALTELLPVLQGTQSLNPHNDYCQHFVDTGHRPQNFIRDVGMSQPVTV